MLAGSRWPARRLPRVHSMAVPWYGLVWMQPEYAERRRELYHSMDRCLPCWMVVHGTAMEDGAATGGCGSLLAPPRAPPPRAGGIAATCQPPPRVYRPCALALLHLNRGRPTRTGWPKASDRTLFLNSPMQPPRGIGLTPGGIRGALRAE